MAEGEAFVRDVAEEKCGFDCRVTDVENKRTDLENSFVFVSGAEDGSDLKALMPHQNGKSDAGSDGVRGLNEGGSGNSCLKNAVPGLMLHRGLNHDSSLVIGNISQALVDKSSQGYDATSQRSAETELNEDTIPNGRYADVSETVEEKVADENGTGFIQDVVKSQCSIGKDLDELENPSFPSENQEICVSSTDIAPREYDFVAVLSPSEISKACQGPESDTMGVPEFDVRDMEDEKEEIERNVVGICLDKHLVEDFIDSELPPGLEKNESVVLATNSEDVELGSISSLVNGSGDERVSQGIQINSDELLAVGGSGENSAEAFENELIDRKSHEGVKSLCKVIENADPEENAETNVYKADNSSGCALNEEPNFKNLGLAESGEISSNVDNLSNGNHEPVDQTDLDRNLSLRSGQGSQRELLAGNGAASSSLLAPENQQYDDIAVSLSTEDVHTQSLGANPMVSSALGDLVNANGLPVVEKGEGFSVCNGDGDAERFGEPVTDLEGDGAPCGTEESIVNTGCPVQSPTISVSNGHASEFECNRVEAVDGPRLETSKKGHGSNGSLKWTSNGSISISYTKHNGSAEPSASHSLSSDKIKEDFPTIYESYPQAGLANIKDRFTNSSPSTSDLKLKPEVHIQSVTSISNCEGTGEVAVQHMTATMISLPCNRESIAELNLQESEEKGDHCEDSAGNCDWKILFKGSEKTENNHADNVSDIVPEDSSKNMTEGEAVAGTKAKPFNYLVRIPRSEDESIKEQIRLAKMHVDEKTKLRDAIQAHIQQKRANSQIHAIDYEYAKAEARNSRKLVRIKRNEIDSLHSVVNKAKNAMSIEDIDHQIRKLENMIQHETLPLKEEKLLIREIKQLKQLREQLSSSLGNTDEINQALEQMEDVEERLKILRKELDVLKDSVLKAEETAIEAGKKYEEENIEVKELQSQFRAADDVRQAAYAHWQSLRKDLWMKNKLFFKYKDDASGASNYAFDGNTEALYRLCLDQVEDFMDMWNRNEEFRREYTRFNARSSVRRFGTLDGCTLGPDEKPIVLPSFAEDGVNRVISKPVNPDLGSANPIPDLNDQTNSMPAAPSGGSKRKVPEIKYQKVDKPVMENGHHGETKNDVHEEPVMLREELQSLQKVEDERTEEVDAELKEQRRLEELAKANEARERKKRQLEKIQLRAELKTQKEAKQKEKEREKRLRKKERKKAAVSDNSDISNNCEASPSSDKGVEITKEIETKYSKATSRKPKKHWLFSKHTKTKSVPPPVRNRNKKKLQQWMWVGATILFILVLFWLGNFGILTSVKLKRRSPVF